MKIRNFLIVGVVCLFGSFVEGASKGMMMKGGLGFVFPDHNSFVLNSGQFSLDRGVGTELSYTTQKIGTSNLQNAGISFAGSTGRFGLGAALNRTGTTLNSSAYDAASVGMGFSFGKDRFTLGGSYSRSIDTAQTNSGLVRGAFTYNSPKGLGPSISVGAGRTIKAGTNITSVIGGFGYQFKNGLSHLELDLALPNVNTTDSYTGSFFATVGSLAFYLSGGYSYQKLGRNFYHLVSGRLGFNLGQSIDLSVLASHIVLTGQNPLLGATFRVIL